MLGSASPHTAPGVEFTSRELIGLERMVPRLGFKSPRRVTGAAAGGFASPFRGRGIDFAEVREYQPGDDIRAIEWRVTARTGRPHTKLFREERERPVLFLVEFNPGLAVGTRVAFKSVVAARSLALLGWMAAHHGDRVGGGVFAPGAERLVRPGRRAGGVLQLIHHLCELQPRLFLRPALPTTSLETALSRLRSMARPGSLLFVIGDFSTLDAAGARMLELMSQHVDLVLIMVYDIIESRLPNFGRLGFGDGTARVVVESGAVGHEHQERFAARVGQVREVARRCRAHVVMLPTSSRLEEVLFSQLRPLWSGI